ncbi:cyclase [Mycobacterium branderi]|uniref:Cyclase n=1 Tax=Mycobacterium branderi TaxID=43348 RepID=A0AA91LZ00_9MYCO|nr:cyclase [Mycobacterium branderi]
MAVPAELRAAARKVSNWGRWGDADELGTLNHITPAAIARAAALVRKGQTFSLSIPIDAYGPFGAHGFRRNPIHLMSVDGGDREMTERLGDWGGEAEQRISEIWRGPMRFNDDYIMMPLQAATQWDALAHVYYEDRLYNGYRSDTVTSFGATCNGIDKVAAAAMVTGRGVLLDIARHAGVEHLEPKAIIAPEDLEATAAAQGVQVGAGDIVIVRTGWWARYLQTREGPTWGPSSPGLSWRCAEWLHERDVAAVASDNIAVETSATEFPGVILPFHMLALRDMGLLLGEMWNLESLGRDCADDGVYEFMLVAHPLLITGAVGSPLNPVAIK